MGQTAALAAAPEAVAAYLVSRASDGASMSTVRMAQAVIGAAHEVSGHESPCKSRAVRMAVKGLSGPKAY